MKSILKCDTAQSRALALILATILSLVAALCFEALCYMVLGPVSTGSWINVYRAGFVVTSLLIVACLYVFRKDASLHLERLFLCVVLLLTCYTSVTIGLNEASWDVGVHYEFMLEWASPDLNNEMTQAEASKSRLGSNHFETSLSELEVLEETLDDSDETDSGLSAKGSPFDVYKRIASIPASMVNAFLTLLGVSFSAKYVLTRLLYALIYSLVTFFGMKKLRSGKVLYAAIALLPTAVFLASNYSYDYWVIAFGLFAVACIVGVIQSPGEKIGWRKAVVPLVAFVIAFGPKAIYFPIVLLALLIPRNRFQTKRGSRLFRVATVATALLIAASFLIPYFFVTGPGIGDTRGGSDVNSVEQIKLILSDPIGFALMLGRFLFGYLSIAFTRSFMTDYAYLGMPSWFTWFAVLAVFAMTTLTDKSKCDAELGTWKTRLWAVILSLGTAALIATSLYISYTPVGASSVAGCQGRYLLPLLFGLLVFLGSPRFEWPRTQKGKALYGVGVLAVMACVNMFGFWQLYVSLLH